jgi:galactose mutarotase-like enzyme
LEMIGSTSQTTWHGQEAWVLENDTLRTVVTPKIGAKLVSLFDKRTGREWLVGPDPRPFREVPYGASFVEQDMSGWDEMFPTIVACDYPAPGNNLGTPLPDHGEVWPLPWTQDQSAPGALRFSVEGVALRYRLTRTLTYPAGDTLLMQYELQNLEQERMPYLWAAHPQFVCSDGAHIILPSEVVDVCNVLPPEWGWAEPETRFAWPEAQSPQGQMVRIDQVSPASRYQARKFFVPPEFSVGWCGLVRRPLGDWLRMDWDPGELPYLGLWIDEGRISYEAVAAPEPMTGYYDSLATAWERKRVAMIEPGVVKAWSLSVRLGTGERPFPINDVPS